MAIVVKDSFEPLSEQSLRPRTDGPLLVESEAMRVLRQELRRYCEGQITGRSFLIAGHRGAGKSTLVSKAFLDVWSDGERSHIYLRPLFIPLHGPSLFPRPEVAPHASVQAPAASAAANRTTKPTSDAKEDADATKSEPRAAAKQASSEPKSDAQIALEQITLGLHRAVAKEFAKRYYERVSDIAHFRQSIARGSIPETARRQAADAIERLLRAVASDGDLYQIAAQFETELYEAPPPQRLLDFWRRVDAVSGGVLFRPGYSPFVGAVPTPDLVALRADAAVVHEQGARELVALASVVEAYRRISGEYTRSDLSKDALQQQWKRDFAAGGALKDIVAPVSALLTGGLAGAGLAATGTSAPGALSGAIIAALAASMILKVSTERKRDRTFTREYQFVFDLSVATLDRVLPILIERLRLAGLAPVFVVDELDKVKGLGTRMLTMVHHLKKLVAENAFFCFLTDRSYYEEMVAAGAQRAYPVEYTYFTQRLFVVFSPEDFERYLRARIPDPDQIAPSAAAGTAQTAADEVATKERTARAIVRWALRHRSQLHVLDLQRAITALRDDEGNVTEDPEEIAASRVNIIDATFQVAIELRLAQPEVEQKGTEQPEFRRLLNDAMYYMTRRSIAGDDTVDLTWETGYAPFVTYLERRAEREDRQHDQPVVSLPTTTWPQASGRPVQQFGIRECEFLFGQVQLLADFLSDRPSPDTTAPSPAPDWRRDLINEWNRTRARRKLPDLEASISNVLLVGERSSILARDLKVRHKYSFRHRLTGRAISELASDSPRAETSPPAPGPASVVVPTIAGDSHVHQTVVLAPPPTSKEEAPSRQQAPQQDEQATPASPDDWRVQAAFVRRFEGAVKAMQIGAVVFAADGTEPIKGIVTLASLQTRFFVIPETPSWSIVEKALLRLEDPTRQGTTYPSHETDVFHVGQLHDVLARNAGVVAGALACAAVVGASAAAPAQGQIPRGLTVISQAYAFKNRDETGVRTALENLAIQIRQKVGVTIDVRLLGEAVRALELELFTERAGKVVTDVAAHVSLRPWLPEELKQSAWVGVQRRLMRWIGTGIPGNPEVDELLAASAGVGPSTVMPYELRGMTAADWTSLLATIRDQSHNRSPASPESVPPWIGLFGLHALGFHGHDSLRHNRLMTWLSLSQTAVDPEPAAIALGLLRTGRLLNGPAPETTVVVIRRTISPLFASMPSPIATPQRGIAMLVATAEQMRILLSAGLEKPMEWLADTIKGIVAVEAEPENITDLEREIYPKLQQVLSDPLIVYAYGDDPGRDLRRPSIIKPKSIEEVVQAAKGSEVKLQPPT